ncbi:hypothetical protein [Halomonas marinisediminis]|uniref:DUF3893 domain-containing protein n=1 Tax=Halomonas marinisediminis TaxID=2546095 RepID=A0ABY2D5F5_9GAMM|nr:hypothetical protein [Halomonas marinisediminis]TDB01912.1 hypothetical protein E0702_10895 [Halomonas marinisediminis]
MTKVGKASLPRMDLRTNVIDLGLDPHRPGAGERAARLAERLLAYCHAKLLTGESLALVSLLYPEERSVAGEVEEDPDAPAKAVCQEEREAEEEAGEPEPQGDEAASSAGHSAEPTSAPSTDESDRAKSSGNAMAVGALDWDAEWTEPRSDAITKARLARMAAARATQLLAYTHGYGHTQARSLRFACVLDVGMWGSRPDQKASSVMGIFGDHLPPAPMDALWGQARHLDGPAQWHEWVQSSGIPEWGSKRGMRGKIALVRLMTLAFRVSLRQAGLRGDARDSDLGLLLGQAVMLQASLERTNGSAGILKGYEIRLELDDCGRLVVEMPRRVQRLPAELADALSEAPYRLDSAAAIHSLCLAARYKLNATRFGSKMEFFYFVSGSRQSRLEKDVRDRGIDAEVASMKQDSLTQRVMISGLVLKNRGMDLVEAFLEELAEGVEGVPERFRPTEVAKVAIKEAGSQQPVFRKVPVTRLQVVYAPELRRDARWASIHEALMAALVLRGAGGASPEELNWRVADTLDATAASDPVLYVQLPEPLRMRSGAMRTSSAWYASSEDHTKKPLARFSHALAVREVERERGRGDALNFDPYTTLKLKIHDGGWEAWRPAQGLNLTLDMVEALGEGRVDRALPSLLDHKLREALHELRVKQGLAVKRPFEVVGRSEAGEVGEFPSTDRASEPFVCLTAQSPRGAPARAVVMMFWWQHGVLHIGDVAMASFRFPREQRMAGHRGMKVADVRRKQMAKAYEQALDGVEGYWCESLREHIDQLEASKLLASGQTLLYSVRDDTLLREELAAFGKRELLGATWRDFPFESLLTDGSLGPEQEGLNMGRSGARGRVSVAQQLISNVRDDIYLQPEGRVVWGMRALIGAKQSVARNNRLMAWRVQGRDPEAPDHLVDLANPHLMPVFNTYTDTLTRDVFKAGQVSRMSLPDKLASTLLRN